VKEVISTTAEQSVASCLHYLRQEMEAKISMFIELLRLLV